MPPAGRRSRSSRPSTSEQISQLRELSDHPEALLTYALDLVDASRDLDVLRMAIGIIGEQGDPAHRDALVRKYEWCETQGARGDTSGYIREAIVKAMQPIVQPGDLALLQRAMTTYQMDGMYETCAGLRAAALIAANNVDPGFAALFAARFLTDPQTSFSGEPALTAIRVLAAQQELAPIFGLVSWGGAVGEVIGEGLRNLTEVPSSLLPLLIERYRESEDEQIVLGLWDLLLGHPSRDDWAAELEQFFRTTTLIDLYGIIAMQVVASRSEILIDRLREIASLEVDSLRRGLLDHALELA